MYKIGFLKLGSCWFESSFKEPKFGMFRHEGQIL